MMHSLPILANSDGELVYIIAVVAFMAIGWVGERLKKMMAGSGNSAQSARRVQRPVVPPMPRPHIPPLPQPHSQQSSRPAVPQAPRPQVPVPQQRRPAPPVSRPVVPPASQVPRQVVDRTLAERRAVIRGESTPVNGGRGPAGRIPVPRPRPAEPRRPVPQPPKEVVVAVVEEEESFARLADWQSQPVTSSQATPPAQRGALSHLRSLRAAASPHVAENVAAGSFQKLTTGDLRRALVLKEILEPPLALRENQGAYM